MAHKPHEECGLFGLQQRRIAVAEETYLALYALQHRGQESAGIAVNDGGVITVHKDMGLVPDVFDRKDHQEAGKRAAGHRPRALFPQRQAGEGELSAAGDALCQGDPCHRPQRQHCEHS